MRLILATLCLFMGGGYMLVTGWYPDVAWLQAVPMRLVWPLAISIGGICLSAMGRRFFARDPVLSSWAILGLAGCFLTIPLIVARENQSGFDQAEQLRFVKSREMLRVERARLAKLSEERAVDRQERAKTDRFVQYEGKIPNDVLSALRDLDKGMQAQLEAQAAVYASALENNPTKGPEAWIRFRTLDQLEIELAAHKALYEQTRAFTQFIESFEETYQAGFTALNLQPPADRIALAEMERVLQFWEQSRVFDLRKLDVRLLGSAISALNLLREAWGTWSYNPREKRLIFDDPANEAAFYENARLFQAIAMEVESIRTGLDPYSDPNR